MMSRAWVLGALLALLAGVAAQAQDFRLLMIESDGCPWCRVFNRDIAPIYERSAEGAAAPLVRADLGGPLPDGVTLKSRPYGTPTFILIGPDGVERDRLVGYPGDDFFWGYIGRMFEAAGVPVAAAAVN
jgi:hypothetical protein